MNRSRAPWALLVAAATVLAAPALAQTSGDPLKTYPGLATDRPVGLESQFTGISSATLDELGGEQGAQVWVDSLMRRVAANSRLRSAYGRLGDDATKSALNDLVLKMLLGAPLDDSATLAALDRADLRRSEFNQLIEAAYESCEASNIRYRTCNRLIVAMGPIEDLLMTR